jgi:hypothetical protein
VIPDDAVGATSIRTVAFPLASVVTCGETRTLRFPPVTVTTAPGAGPAWAPTALSCMLDVAPAATASDAAATVIVAGAAVTVTVPVAVT